MYQPAGGLREEADGSPERDEHADRQEPVDAPWPVFARFALRCHASSVLDDGVDVPDHHRQAERKGQLFDEDVEVQELLHVPDGTSAWA